MREIIIDNRESGQRFDKYLKKYLRQAGSGFIYKMLRKKNITLNGRKASGNELLSEGDSVKMFFSDDTFEKFTAGAPDRENEARIRKYDVEILYEDDDVIFLNKPVGLLSQGDGKGGVSLVDILSSYLAHTDERSGKPSGFRPGICNRLDRNTSGVVAAGKTVRGLQELSEAIRTKTVHKIYACVVEGQVDEGKCLKGYLTKDSAKNIVSVSDVKTEGASYIETIYRPVKTNGLVTLLEVELVTGKSHQIRAHMANEGHPVVGDVKYGSKIKQPAGYQLLHAHKMVFDKTADVPASIAGLVIEAQIPVHYIRYFE
ncbi:MAG: RluA family pseudouridine synthase [Lachnospiraceae bacterium]|nr:RluA family pseudouridine synthase [Lachnospiraceae bacterium]